MMELRRYAHQIYAFFVAGGGITLSELRLWEGWVNLTMKAIGLIIMVITLMHTYNKWRASQHHLTTLDGGDNEDGSSGSGPGEDGDD